LRTRLIVIGIGLLALTFLLGSLSGAARQIRIASDTSRATLHAQSLLAQVGVGETLEPGRRQGNFDAGRYRETLIYLDQRAQLQQERIDLMVLRGYCYLNLKMYGDATRIFEAAAATGSRDAARGLADVRNVTHPDVND
jgi:hypothetical protein